MRQLLIFPILLTLVLGGCGPQPDPAASPEPGPELTVEGDRFLLDGAPFDMWGIRVASATQNDSLTQHLIEQLDEYRAHGVNSISTYYMGSSGRNSDPFSPDGASIDPAHQERTERIIQEAAARDMVVVVGIFYQHAPFGLRDAEAVRSVVRNVTRSLRPYANIIINIANEQNSPGWEDSAGIFDFRDPEAILELVRVAREADPERLVGGGGYDHDKNIVIGRSPDVDVLLFDTNGPDPDSGELYDRFVRNGVVGKPIVNVELFGGWTGQFEHGLFPDSLKQVYYDEVDAAAARPGLSVYFHNNHWLQSQEQPLHYDLGGDGSATSPGMRWYFEYVRQARAQNDQAFSEAADILALETPTRFNPRVERE